MLLIDAYDRGKAIFSYNSNPDYFSFDDKHSFPQGADGLAALCRVLNCSSIIKQLDAILHTSLAIDGDLTDETDRHEAFAQCLKFPTFSVGYSYECLIDDSLPPDLDKEDLIHVKSV